MKVINLFVRIFLYYFLKNIFIFGNALESNITSPVISIVASTGYDYKNTHNLITLSSDKSMKLVPSNARMVLMICNATYPVTWQLDYQAQGSDAWSLSLKTRRFASNIFDTTTFQYSAELNFYQRPETPWTGNYTCRSTANEDIHSYQYLFWEGSTQLIHAYKNLTVYADENVAVIPCLPGKSKAKLPSLQKKNGKQTYVDVNLDKTTTYNPKKGFILTNKTTMVGQYKCIIKGKDEKEWVNVEVKLSIDNFIPPSKDSNASFIYDKMKKTLICCSNSRRSPKLINFYCRHPTLCNFKSLMAIPRGFYYSQSKKAGRRGCSKVKLYATSPGIAHCVGDGIDMIKRYVFPMKYARYWYTMGRNYSIPAYMQWNEIRGEEMMQLHLTKGKASYPAYYYGYGPDALTNNLKATLYNGEIITVLCEPSDYYFADGLQWIIKWKNSTVQLLNNTYNNNVNRFSSYSAAIQVVLHLDMESIICAAPVWNSTEYIFKPLNVYVNASSPATMVGDRTDESVTWIMNDTGRSIECKARGIPIPTFRWIKVVGGSENNVTVGANDGNITQVVNNVTHEISETLVVHIVSNTSGGIYICTASNTVATVSRKITVSVEEPSSVKKMIAAVVGVLLSLTLLVGLGLLVWKLMRNRRIIKQETNTTIGFNNSVNREGFTAEVNNSNYDVPRLSSNLIN